MPSKQIRRTGLRTPQTRYEQNVLNGAFIRCAAFLPHGRPEPKHCWDSRARLDSIPHPAHDAVLLTRAAMRDAIESGDPDVIRQTRLAIESYFTQCAQASLDVGAAGSTTVPVTDVVKDECEAVTAIVAASECPSAGTFDTARQATVRMIDAATTWLRGADKDARTAHARMGVR